MTVEYPQDWHVHKATKRHPVCCFFEAFPSSPDPDETFYGTPFCHMALGELPAKTCKGDYLICPLKFEPDEPPELTAADFGYEGDHWD